MNRNVNLSHDHGSLQQTSPCCRVSEELNCKVRNVAQVCDCTDQRNFMSLKPFEPNEHLQLHCKCYRPEFAHRTIAIVRHCRNMRRRSWQRFHSADPESSESQPTLYPNMPKFSVNAVHTRVVHRLVSPLQSNSYPIVPDSKHRWFVLFGPLPM